jgi:hypothetical protein
VDAADSGSCAAGGDCQFRGEVLGDVGRFDNTNGGFRA